MGAGERLRFKEEYERLEHDNDRPGVENKALEKDVAVLRGSVESLVRGIGQIAGMDECRDVGIDRMLCLENGGRRAAMAGKVQGIDELTI